MPVKPGYKTTELLVVVLTILGNVAFAAADKVPARYASIVSGVAAAAYALARGLAKRPAPIVVPPAAGGTLPVASPPPPLP